MFGNVLTQKDALGDTTTNAYDGFGNLASVTDPDSHTIRKATATTTRTWGNFMLSETDDASTSNTTYYAYNSLNELTSQSETVATDATHTTTATTAYLHDADGDLTQTTDPDGHIITDTYDNLNRLTQENWYQNSTYLTDAAPANTINYSYNLSQLTAAYDDASGYSYQYDSLGQMTAVDNLGGQTHGTAYVPDVLLNYGYYADGNEQTLSATIGATAGVGGTADFKNTYAYNAAQWLTSVTQQGQTDGNAVAAKRANFNYDASADMTDVKRYSDTSGSALVASSVYQFDASDRLTNLTHTAADGTTTFADYAWTYDGADRVKSFTNSANIASYSAENIGTYSYDAAGELTGATFPTGGSSSSSNTLANSYDGNGNPTNTGDSVGAGNRLLSDGTWNYTYDANGNTLTQVGVSGGSQAGKNEVDYDYDIGNRLIEGDQQNRRRSSASRSVRLRSQQQSNQPQHHAVHERRGGHDRHREDRLRRRQRGAGVRRQRQSDRPPPERRRGRFDSCRRALFQPNVRAHLRRRHGLVPA